MKNNNWIGSISTKKVPYKHFLWIMRTTFILLFTCVFCSMAEIGHTQNTRVTLNKRNSTLQEVLNDIEKQTDYLFIYNNEINTNEKVSVRTKEEAVSSVLKSLLKDKDIDYSMEGNHIILSINEYVNSVEMEHSRIIQQQQKMISGTVSDEEGELIIGANIIEKGTNNGTVTDIDGSFSLDVADNSVLHITYIGYFSQEVDIQGKNVVNIVLQEDTKTLDELVVVGYGVQKKSVVTGSISSVKASELENMPINRIEQALQGRTSGLTIAQNTGQPGSMSTIRVRGLTSFNNNEPLWVVDGVVVNSSGMGFLNQSDIESIEVLKDAASQAIYGARAAAGVILVTTKKGKTGKISVNYNGYFGVSSPAKKLDLLNATEYATIRNESLRNDGKSELFSNPSSYGIGTDWQDIVFNNSAKRHNHEMNISGGNEISTYYASFGYLDQEGIVASDISNYTRISIRLNSEHKITSWLKFGQNLGYGNEKHKSFWAVNSEMGGPLASAIHLDPITPITLNSEEANYPPYSSEAVISDANGNPYAISNYVGQEMVNPLAYIQTERGNNNWSENIIGNVFAEITPIKNLILKTTLGTKLAFWGVENFSPVYYLNAGSTNSQTSFNRSLNRVMDWNVENTASYTKNFGHNNLMTLVGQGAYVDNDTRGLNVTYFNIPINDFDSASHNFNVPKDSRDGFGGEGVQHKVTSLFARINYNYDEKYLFEGLIRRDGSSRFGTNNRYGYFPSFSLGWVVSRESFLQDNDYINSLKLRGGYGVVGNDNIGNFAYLSTIGGGRNYAFGTSGSYLIGYSPNAPSNPDLKWEETSQTNIGLDMVYLRDFRLTFDWYKKVTSDILQYPRIPSYIGASSNPAANVADMKNMGLEFELGYQKKIGNVDLSVNGNLSYLENEVTNLGRGVEYLSGGESFQSSSYPITRTAVGHAYGSFYGFKTLGIFQNQAEIDNYKNSEGIVIQPNAQPGDFKWTDTNDNGEIDEDDRMFIGDPTPKYSFGLTLNLAWKGFDAMIFGQGVAGNKIFQGLRRLDISGANYQRSALERWTGEGTTNSYPRLTDDDPNKNLRNPSDFYLEDGSYFRLKVVQLGYTLNGNLVKKVGLTKARIYITGENILTLTKYTGYDPEIGGGIMSIDRGVYPQARSFMVGLNIGF